MRTSSFLILAILPCMILANLSCMDSKGNPVTWWSALKYPEGLASRYGYLDSTSGASEFGVLDGHVDDDETALSYTIKAINANDGSLVIYNDEPPNEETIYTGAHAKGFVAYDEDAEIVLFLMHSVPKYPNVTKEGDISVELPENSFEYGQNFFCVTLKVANADVLKAHLALSQVNTYFTSGTFEDLDYYGLFDTEQYSADDFEMVNGDKITLLSKSPSYDKYLWDTIVPNYYKSDLIVESWGRPYQAPACQPDNTQDVTNAVKISLPNGDNWDSEDDHSKWGVSYNNEVSFACPADMNRMSSQITRGGSAWCYVNANFAKAYSSLITSYTKCDSDELLPPYDLESDSETVSVNVVELWIGEFYTLIKDAIMRLTHA